MKSRLVLAAMLSAVVLSPAAFAGSTGTGPSAKSANLQVASMTPAEQCTALQGQWQKDGMAHKSNAKFTEAQKLADQGKQLCSTGKANDGVAKLEQALKDIGLKPQV